WKVLPRPSATLFPYTTLFRSDLEKGVQAGCGHALNELGEVAHREQVVQGGRPGSQVQGEGNHERPGQRVGSRVPSHCLDPPKDRSEEHTSELQSRENLVCRLL